ncbi:MAG: T9SS type A sorting domain-containing protein [candidate division WOR-3 bacterium]
MKKVGVLIILLPALLLGRTVTINTGSFQIQLNDFGRIRVLNTAGTRQMDRVSLLAGVSESAVFDYRADGNTRTATDSTGGTYLNSFEIYGVFDNSYSNLPPAVAESVHIYTWQNKNFAICQFFVKNETGTNQTFYLSWELISQVGGTYENDTSEVIGNNLVAIYDGSQGACVGFLLLSPSQMYSYRAVPWGSYQYADAFYWSMMTSTETDYLVPGDADGLGGVFNAGPYYDVEPGSTMYAALGIIFGSSKDDVQLAVPEVLSYYEGVNVAENHNSLVKVRVSVIRGDLLKISGLRDTYSYAIFDISGKEVATGQVNADGFINLRDNLSKGLYFLRLSVNNKTSSIKFVVLE